MDAEIKFRNLELSIHIHNIKAVKEFNDGKFDVYENFTDLLFLDTHYIFVGDEILCANGKDIEYVLFSSNL